MTDKTKLHVIAPDGELLEERTLVNAPWKALYPQREMVIVDWLANQRKKPNLEELMTPVLYDNSVYQSDLYWGSGVKEGKTIGVLEGFLDRRLVKHAEDGQRVGRYLLAEGHWGKYHGPMRIRISPVGTVTPYGVIHDGGGFMRKSLADSIATDLEKIQLSRARESYTFWQRIPWSEELEDEIEPILKKQVMAAADVSELLMQYSPASFEEKKELYEADNAMEEHPFIVNAIARSSGEMLARLATTANVGTRCGVAVPTETQVCVPWLPHDCPMIIYRHPIDSFGSIQAVTNDLSELERVMYGVTQFTLAAFDLFAKGCAREVETDDFDLWLCNEDIKMAEQPLEEVRALDYIETDAVFAATQRHKEGHATGINIDWAKDRMGFDVDGDIKNVVDAREYPALYEAVQQLPQGQTPKLTKTKSKLDERTKMIHKSMMNLVGFATKVSSDTFMVQDREYVGKQLGFEGREELDQDLNYNIKAGTDGYKTNEVDQNKVNKHLSIMQSNMLRIFGKLAVYTDWPNDQAFTHMIPKLFEEGMDEDEAVEAIMPWMDGTVPSILRKTLPGMQNALEEPFKVEPLTKFRYWAIKPDGQLYMDAKQLQSWYNARSQKVNWMDSNDIQKFKLRWQEEIAMSPYDRWDLANAVWYIAHSARSEFSGAGSVFLGFHDEAVRIIKEKPGAEFKRSKFHTILVGMNHQLPKTDTLEDTVEIVDVPIRKDGRMLVRKAVVAEVDGQRQPRDRRYPQNMIALVATNADQPQEGTYKVRITKNSQNSWLMTFI